MVGLAEPLQRQIAQARAHRIPDHQRAGEHGHGNGDAGNDGEIGPPVVNEAPPKEA